MQWYDMTTSVHLGISPGVSVDELQHPLPCPDAIWDAPNAQQWKDKTIKFQGKSNFFPSNEVSSDLLEENNENR